ncbi:MAG: acyl-CoA dehydrogenase family protein [Porticoccaceae bacterium]|nr:acyl-CoA dehydrogenase family protein [Porticoccaceae bacterium]
MLRGPSLEGLFTANRDGRWSTLTGDSEFGGQSLPHILGGAVDEMFQSANLGFSLLPLLTVGVITALDKSGSYAEKNQYLPNLISGEW